MHAKVSSRDTSGTAAGRSILRAKEADDEEILAGPHLLRIFRFFD